MAERPRICPCRKHHCSDARDVHLLHDWAIPEESLGPVGDVSLPDRIAMGPNLPLAFIFVAGCYWNADQARRDIGVKPRLVDRHHGASVGHQD